MHDHGQRSLKRIAWMLALAGVAFGVLGEPMGWYATLSWYDELLHASTSFWLTLLIAVYARSSIFRNLDGHRLWKLALIVGAGVSVGVVWEIGEWLVDHAFGGETVKGRYDTSIDLLLDSIGALLGAGVGLGATTRAAPFRLRSSVSRS
jgi:hypothetical protein